MAIISDSSPLIALVQIGQLALLESLYTTVLIPSAVRQEIVRSVPLHPWLQERPLTRPVAPRVRRAGLGRGESEAISLALELRGTWTILDDLGARRLAMALNIPVIGTLGVLVESKQRGLLDEIRPSIDALLSQGFFVAPGIYEQVLRAVDEW